MLSKSHSILPKTQLIPSYSVILYNDFDFKGEEKSFRVFDKQCYDLPDAITGYVLSGTLDPKIWYCTFFPKKACERGAADETHQLSAGEYDNLFPDGMDFVSFRCELYAEHSSTKQDHLHEMPSQSSQRVRVSLRELSEKYMHAYGDQLDSAPRVH